MLDVARIESQTLKLDKSTVDVNEEIANVIRDLAAQTGIESRKQVPIVFEPMEKIMIFADKARVLQVFANLINNAMTFTRNGNIININAMKNVKTAEAIVTITDRGTGLDPKMLTHIFSKFKTSSDKGTGLGLYISKNIVEAHGGRIDAQNNTDGKGATFTVTLPIATN
jgi:signal transduction histidine kinase